MSAVFSIGISGMAAAQAQLGGAAHNVANAQTPSFRRQLASPQAMPGGGVRVGFRQAAEPGQNLAADLVSQRQAVYAFKANLRTVQTADEMMGALLDAFA